MKKYILAFILSASVLLCSGCSNSDKNSELDELINGLQTMYLGGGSEDPEDAKPSYKSITGTIIAVAKKNITVKTNDKEYKVATDKNPQIFGGAIEKELTVTVTFESDQDEEKTITPVTITILDGNPDTTISEEETAPPQEEENTEGAEETSNEPSETKDPEATEPEAETEENADITTAPEDTQIQTADETTAEKEDNSLDIAKIQQQITACQNDIQSYKLKIQQLNTIISDCEREQDNLNGDLKQAKIELENAKKKTVYVYDGNGFKQTPDKGAVNKAQENVDYYENLIADYDSNISIAKASISECELEISTLEGQIAVYQAVINELSQ